MKKVKQYDLALINDDEKEVIELDKKDNDVLQAYPVENNQPQPQQPVQNNYYQPQPQQPYYPNNGGYNNYYPQQPQYQPINNYNNNYYPGYNQQPQQQVNPNIYNEPYIQPQGNYAQYNNSPYTNPPQGQFVNNIPNNNPQSSLLNNQNGLNAQKDANSEKEFVVKQALIKNPFLFDDFPENNYINSIEDFYVTFKKDEYKIGDLVRKKDVKKGRKKKIFKESFKVWKDEVDQRLEDDSLIGAGQFDNSEKTNNEVIKVGFWQYFLSVVSLILACILVTKKIKFFAVSSNLEGTEFLDKIARYETIAYNIIIPIAIALVILCIILNVQASSFGKINKYAKAQYKKKLADIKKKFNKKYTTTYNYYHNAYKGNFKKDPLSISKTAIGTKTFMEVESLVANTSQRTSVENKKNGGYKFVRGIIKFFVFLITFITVSDALVHLVVSLIKLIFKK